MTLLPIRSEPPGGDAVAYLRQEDGRWRWNTRSAAAARAAGTAAGTASLLSFDTAAEAAADVALHVGAARDPSGRLVMTRDYLRRLISAIALPCAACADVYFGGVYWHRRDAGGANWGVAVMNGAGDHAGCLAAVADAREALRRRYSIADEA